jgi:hypothetical protein
MKLRNAFIGLMTLPLMAEAAFACQTTTATRNQRAPVTISRCETGLADDKTGPRDHWLEIGTVYKNATDRPIASIHFRFDIYDRLGKHLETDFTDDTYGLDPHAESDPIAHDVRAEALAAEAQPSAPPMTYYDPTWQFVNAHPAIENVVCSVDMVKFGDGKTWEERRPISSAEVARLLKNRHPGDFAWAPDQE